MVEMPKEIVCPVWETNVDTAIILNVRFGSLQLIVVFAPVEWVPTHRGETIVRTYVYTA